MNEKSQYTVDGALKFLVRQAEYYRKCYKEGSQDELAWRQAKALVSAAPELLQALELVAAMISPDGIPDDEGNVYVINVIDEECEARLMFTISVIEKAKGETV